IKELKMLGCRVVMLTGDSREVAEVVAGKLGIEDFRAELMPVDKVNTVRILKKEGTTVFAGDGMNDAPVIAEADVGVAMGAMGSDAAIETADVVIMDDKISKIPKSIRLSRKIQNVVWQNIFLILVIKGLLISMGALGMATMWEAVFADVGTSLIATINAIRVFSFN
ncbi:MAG: heavy metal translocating P-type ATPase, partial [Archaeoglobus sp.]